ncbi:MAG TPA: serine/threonine-protein kinase, partial [Opitutus sp.]|nr:serine/threonine-protein kinase [Opitutus sp.]
MNQEEALFAAAIALPIDRRAAYLDVACAGDATLRQRLESLLRAHDHAASNMPSAAPGFGETVAAFKPRPEERAGDLIGRYKLLQQIGEGGCGVVYMAEQTAPVVRRVALKVIKLGMDTKAVIARFEAERQALAMMDHPNIAKVLDAGTTDNGRPFFVMELVRGIPITKYCDENNVSTAARLSLFEQVCHAIQHAHQKGIIHRDIKPSNILVTLHDGVPVPKVIDFGIAKATQGKLTDATVFTAFEQFIGTPAYMSPEQAEMSGLDIDTRSDIYSLGVLLYELLTGRPPFDPKSFVEAGLDEMRRMIREVEPPKPSTRLNTLTVADRTTVAKLRGTQPTQLRSQLSGDLDWIVMKALEKNRMRRYESASAFAADLQRHLHNEPVTAR